MTASPRRPSRTFPFSAIVGQETLKLALLLNAVDSRVGGVLIRGEKGTAKSTAVRALAAVLPSVDVVEGCRFSCDPSDPAVWCTECRTRRESGPLPKSKRAARVVDLPVSATEDRLIGSLDLEHALKHGERVYEPGLLAMANRSILYVDEVNLLDDHLVDTLLDAAAMGVNTIEREGVSFTHPARFILVGTMNPEEGEIRPQLLDRFGLCVDVEGVREPESRVEIVRRRRAFEEDPGAFERTWAEAEDTLSANIKHARLRLPGIVVQDELLYAVANLALTAGVDGHRADQVMVRAAAAHAALAGRTAVELADVARVAPLVLAHRLRRTLFDEPRLDATALSALINRALGTEDGADEAGEAVAATPGDGQTSIFDGGGSTAQAAEDLISGRTSLEQPLDRTRRSISGRRQETVSADGHGRYSRSEPARPGVSASDVALDASIRAAAPYQLARADQGDLAISISPSDVQSKVRTRKVGASIVFCVDASGSMGASSRMEAAKAAVLDLLVDAYQRRDRVSVISFRGESAEVVLAPTGSVELANLKLRRLPTGGATPLAAGLVRALELIDSEKRRSPDVIPWLVLVTDGRANVGIDGGVGSEDAKVVAGRVRAARINAVLLDTGGQSSSSAAARELAREAGAEYVKLASLTGEVISETVRQRLLGGK